MTLKDSCFKTLVSTGLEDPHYWSDAMECIGMYEHLLPHLLRHISDPIQLLCSSIACYKRVLSTSRSTVKDALKSRWYQLCDVHARLFQDNSKPKVVDASCPDYGHERFFNQVFGEDLNRICEYFFPTSDCKRSLSLPYVKTCLVPRYVFEFCELYDNELSRHVQTALFQVQSFETTIKLNDMDLVLLSCISLMTRLTVSSHSLGHPYMHLLIVQFNRLRHVRVRWGIDATVGSVLHRNLRTLKSISIEHCKFGVDSLFSRLCQPHVLISRGEKLAEKRRKLECHFPLEELIFVSTSAFVEPKPLGLFLEKTNALEKLRFCDSDDGWLNDIKGWTCIFESMSKNLLRLKHLEFADVSLPRDIRNDMRSLLKRLESFYFSTQTPPWEGFFDDMAHNGHYPKMNTMVLCELESSAGVGAFLETTPNLKHLTCRMCHITSEPQVSTFFNAIKSLPVESVNLTGTTIIHKDLNPFIDHLFRIPSLREIDISQANLKRYIPFILQRLCINDSSIKNIAMQGIGYRDEHVNILAKHLKNTKSWPTSIQYIDLAHNIISDDGYIVLCDILRRGEYRNNFNINLFNNQISLETKEIVKHIVFEKSTFILNGTFGFDEG